MAYIPENHKQYNLIPMAVKGNWEVCEYESVLLDKLEKILGYCITPYNITSIDNYLREVDEATAKYRNDAKIQEIVEEYEENIRDLNDKRCWSILKYIGPNTSGLTHGKYYYWVCSKSTGEYRGIIDDENFTAYQHNTSKKNWELIEDPTGMAEYVLGIGAPTECGGIKQWLQAIHSFKRKSKD